MTPYRLAREVEERHNADLAAEKESHRVARSTLAELQTKIQQAPVSDEHAKRLRDVAANLRECLHRHRPFTYLGGDQIGEEIWRNAFREHFPEAAPLLDRVEETRKARDAASENLRSRITAEPSTADSPTLPGTRRSSYHCFSP